jgi:Icc-related predicted phosphoesterase
VKIQIASDLHLEFLHDLFPGERLISPAVGADVLILAGDIACGTHAIELFKDWPVPVLYLAGNHEFYGTDFSTTRAALRQAAEGTNVKFLDNDTIHLCGVRFLGTTLWTDYRLELNRTQTQLLENAELRINDHFKISCGDGKFTARKALAEHESSRAWLENELATPYDGKTVVVSHHGPHRLSVHPRFVGDPINAAFVSDLSDVLPKADLWIHGHVHDSFDYRVLGCRVVANPAGYAANRRFVSIARELILENTAFQMACLVEV